MKKRSGKLLSVVGMVAALAMTLASCDLFGTKIVADPVITVAEDGVTVTIASATEGAEIKYSVNDEAEKTYEGAFKLTQNRTDTEYTIAAIATKDGVESAKVTKKVTVKGSAAVYKVTFDVDGVTSEVTVLEGDTVAKPEDPAKDGYSFDGWFNGETAYDFESLVTSDLTLKASLTEIVYTITYDLNGGTNAETNPTTYKVTSDDITLAAPKGPETAPNFVAWHKDTADGETVQTITKGSTGNITLVAEFSAKAIYKVIYFNGETKLGEVSVAEGGKIENKSFDVEGYGLEGWYLDAELTTKITDFTTTEVKAETKVYGKFVKNLVYFTVKFDLNGGTGTIANQKIESGTSATQPENPTTEDTAKPNFAGWTTTKDDASTAFSFTTKITSDITLYALWAANPQFDVKFDKNYEGSSSATDTVEEGSTVEKPASDPTRDGYFFTGWFTDAECTTAATFPITVTANVTLYAGWQSKVVYEDETGTAISWGTPFVISKDLMQYVNKDSVLSFTFTADPDDPDGYAKIALNDVGQDIKVESPDVKTATNTLLTLGSDAAVEYVKANGLSITGYNVTITKILILGTQKIEKIADAMISCDGDSSINVAAINTIKAKAAPGTVVLTLYCKTAIAPTNAYDWVGRLSGFTEDWTFIDTADNDGDIVVQLPNISTNDADFTVSYNVDTILPKVPDVAHLCVNIYGEKITISKAEISYVEK